MSLIEQLRRTGGIQRLQGKEYVTFGGLLGLAHGAGVKSIEPVMVESMTGERYVFRCTVTGERGVFVAHGDADAGNVKKGMAGAMLRMAETRSVCRALRMYLGIGMTAKEELPGKVEEKPTPAPKWTVDERKAFADHVVMLGYHPRDVAQLARSEGWRPFAEWPDHARAKFLHDLEHGKFDDGRLEKVSEEDTEEPAK